MTFADLLALTGDVGGRALFARHPIAYVPWHAANLLLDIDTRKPHSTVNRVPGMGGSLNGAGVIRP